MSFSRTTDTGRRITATPRVREEPDMKRLVALVLHLAEQLHQQELHDRSNDTDAVEEGHDDDALTPSSTRS